MTVDEMEEKKSSEAVGKTPLFLKGRIPCTMLLIRFRTQSAWLGAQVEVSCSVKQGQVLRG